MLEHFSLKVGILPHPTLLLSEYYSRSVASTTTPPTRADFVDPLRIHLTSTNALKFLSGSTAMGI